MYFAQMDLLFGCEGVLNVPALVITLAERVTIRALSSDFFDSVFFAVASDFLDFAASSTASICLLVL